MGEFHVARGIRLALVARSVGQIASGPAPSQSILAFRVPLGPMTIVSFFPRLTYFEMGPPLPREEGSERYWSLPFYWA